MHLLRWVKICIVFVKLACFQEDIVGLEIAMNHFGFLLVEIHMAWAISKAHVTVFEGRKWHGSVFGPLARPM